MLKKYGKIFNFCRFYDFVFKKKNDIFCTPIGLVVKISDIEISVLFVVEYSHLSYLKFADSGQCAVVLIALPT